MGSEQADKLTLRWVGAAVASHFKGPRPECHSDTSCSMLGTCEKEEEKGQPIDDVVTRPWWAFSTQLSVLLTVFLVILQEA